MNQDFVDLLSAFTAADVRFLAVVRRPFGPIEVDYIGRHAFLQNKRATGRTKDLADIEGFE